MSFQKTLTEVLAVGALIFAELAALPSHATGSRPSTVPGVGIRNFHKFAAEAGTIYRGAQPTGKENEAAAIGVNSVLIFKKPVRSDVDKEIQRWKQLGFDETQIHHIPAEWQGQDPAQDCEFAVAALQLMKQALETPDSQLYVHCTAGEDRTGLLMGLTRVLREGWTVDQAFRNEMCAYGYSEGNPHKPAHVTDKINRGLTPLFLRLVQLHSQKRFSWKQLDASVCAGIAGVKIPSPPEDWHCR